MVLRLDHIDPVANGGGKEEGNLITACQSCNSGKRDMTGVAEIIQARRDADWDLFDTSYQEMWGNDADLFLEEEGNYFADHARVPLRFYFDVYAAARELPPSAYIPMPADEVARISEAFNAQ